MLKESTLEFYRQLRENNNKPWFDSVKKRYEDARKDYVKLVETLLEETKKIDESLEALTARECTFRINRDVRFSQDKSPYKTYMGISFTPYGKKMALAGYYVHIDEFGESFSGGGLYMPDANALKRIRTEIHLFPEEFRSIINHAEFKACFGKLDSDPGIILRRPPKGYETDDPAIEFLKFKSFTAVRPIKGEILTTPKLIDSIFESFRAVAPLVKFLNNALWTDPNGERL